MVHHDGITIGTISGGIVNFGGAIFISPISVTKSISGSGGNNTATKVITINILDQITPTKKV
jgi:hypothetical protein